MRLLAAVFTTLVLVLGSAPPATAAEPELANVTVEAARTSLALDGTTRLRVRGTMSDGRRADLRDATISYATSDPRLATVAGAVARAGTFGAGTATITATVTLDGVTKAGTVALTVLPQPARPFRLDYHQTLTMKMFMADNAGRVSLTFEQGLEVVRKVDNLTRGVPKIFYLVGWQYDGHDTGYPAWDVVNPKLKRAEDETALDSLRWLMREARRHHTTISFHINMLDINPSSPLWNTYLERDVIARNADGTLKKYRWGYPISYTREWDEGLAQQRIATLIDLVDLRRVGTVHIDAFHQYIPGFGTDPISPYHGITTDQEIATQKKIFRYWRDRGVDVTSELTYSYRKDPMLGLQPMAWHFRGVDPMAVPPTLHIGGKGGDARFGGSMQGESTIKRDPVTLAGFLPEFCTTTLLWYYLNRLDRLSFTDGVATFSDGVTSANVDGKLLVRRGEQVLRDGDDLFVPALWRHRPEIVAYSGAGYENRTWTLPADWRRVRAVDVHTIGLDGLTERARAVPVTAGRVALSLPAGTAVSIRPADRGT
jgi:hypothetical protein